MQPQTHPTIPTSFMYLYRRIFATDFYPLLAISLLFLWIVQSLNGYYLPRLETRIGYQPYDPISEALPCINLSIFIFVVLYGSMFVGVVGLLKHKEHLLKMLVAFSTMYLIRLCTITLLPLEPPAGLVELQDPILESLFNKVFLKKDLFFSGHFSTMFIFFLVAPTNKYKWYFLAASVAMAFLVWIQHIHYTFDVAGGVCFSILSVKITEKILEKIGGIIE